MDNNAKIFVAGHRGLVGSAIVRKLKNNNYNNLLLRTSKELDLRNQQAVAEFFDRERPDYVFLAAAKVGGILANNKFRADFIYENLMIEANVVHQSYLYGVKKLLFLGSSCIYPKFANQPMDENELLTGDLEYTNEPYAISKIAGIKLCESYNLQYETNFISAMPTNLYGINDNFDLETSHVLPALIRKFYQAKQSNSKNVTLWGTGSPKREFLYVDDLANACLFLMNNIDFKDIVKLNSSKSKSEQIKNTHINIGTGKDISIKELSELIQNVTGFTGDIVWDDSKPDGTPRKLLNVEKINKLGWKAEISLEDGILKAYNWYMNSLQNNLQKVSKNL